MAQAFQGSAQSYFALLERRLSAAADPSQADAMSAYMRHQFDFYGIKAPLRKSILQEIIREHGLPKGDVLQAVIRLCWQAPQREWQQLANDILMKAKKQLTADFMELIEWCILHKSWWDTVDFLAGHSMAAILSRHPKLERTEPDRWIASNNIWLQRTALLYQLFYRDQLDFERLKDYILLVADSKEFFVQKAAGWALRQASRLRGPEVIEFVQTHDDLLPKLTKTEALKWLEHQSKKS